MGAGDDFLAGIAALLDAEGLQAIQRKLLRGPLFALFGGQARQAVEQVEGFPACARIGMVGPFPDRRDAQGAALVAIAVIDLDRVAIDADPRISRRIRFVEGAADLQVVRAPRSSTFV